MNLVSNILTCARARERGYPRGYILVLLVVEAGYQLINGTSAFPQVHCTIVHQVPEVTGKTIKSKR